MRQLLGWKPFYIDNNNEDHYIEKMDALSTKAKKILERIGAIEISIKDKK